MNETTDYDGAWKETLEFYLEPFLTLCFPDVSKNIDWQAGFQFLDKELQEIVRDADLGKQRADKLIQVQKIYGEKEMVLLHVEVENWQDKPIDLRLFQYNHRITDRFGKPVVTLVIYGDLNAQWKPHAYHFDLWGCQIHFEFPICKLVELEASVDLEASDNPAAIVISAHLAAMRQTGNPEMKLQIKWNLTRRLYERGYDRKDIFELYRLIDWMIVLPEDKNLEFYHQLLEYEKENTMPYHKCPVISPTIAIG
jgi:hypothetical protein